MMKAITVNGVAEFMFHLSSQADNNQTVFNVVASFGGDNVSTATASMTTLNGSTYDVCTTTQYNTFKPSSNSTTITVEPQTTIGATTLMSLDQLKAKANQYTRIKNEFFLGWPFYRVHMWITIGASTIELAFNPILPGGEIARFTGLDQLLAPIPPPTSQNWQPAPPPPDETSRIISAIVTSAIQNIVGLSITAVAGGLIPVPGPGLIALIAYGVASGAWIGMALSQYSSAEPGAHLRALARLAGLAVSFLANAVGAALPFVRGLFFKSAVVPLLSTFLSNLIDPLSLKSALEVADSTLWIALFASFALLLIPLPTSQTFKDGFISISVGLFAATLTLLFGLKP